MSDLHKVTDVDIRFRTQELLEEVSKHEDWILESIIWDANHKVDINREGLNTILEKAKNDEFLYQAKKNLFQVFPFLNYHF